jgi:hypothetical protein
MMYEVYGNVAHSGPYCLETHEDATYLNNGYRQQGGGSNNNGWNNQFRPSFQGNSNYNSSYNSNQPFLGFGFRPG